MTFSQVVQVFYCRWFVGVGYGGYDGGWPSARLFGAFIARNKREYLRVTFSQVVQVFYCKWFVGVGYGGYNGGDLQPGCSGFLLYSNFWGRPSARLLGVFAARDLWGWPSARLLGLSLQAIFEGDLQPGCLGLLLQAIFEGDLQPGCLGLLLQAIFEGDLQPGCSGLLLQAIFEGDLQPGYKLNVWGLYRGWFVRVGLNLLAAYYIHSRMQACMASTLTIAL